ELAARLDTIRTDLDRSTTTAAITADPTRPPPAADIDARMALAREWDHLIDQVRALPGLNDFARPPVAAQLRHAATGGTIVVVNISEWRCDALLVTDTTTRVKKLPDLTHDTAVDRANTYLQALHAFETTSRDPNTARAELEQAITTTLEWLWDTIAGPVMDTL